MYYNPQLQLYSYPKPWFTNGKPPWDLVLFFTITTSYLLYKNYKRK